MIRLSALATGVSMIAALALATAALAGGTTVTRTAHSGSVTATYSSRATRHASGYTTYSQERLTIVRAGTTGYSGSVNCDGCAPGGQPGGTVSVTDINRTGEPNVVLDLYTGGAHCCTVAQVYTYSPASGAYSELQHNFFDPGYKLEALTPGGDEVFLSANAAFEYEFTDFADSGVPIEILAIQNGRFVDVTRTYPSRIATDAARWLKAFKQAKTNAGGLLAAWAADEELLGHDALVQSTLTSALDAGRLKGNLVANGRKYITLLNRFLVKEGYKA